MLTLYVQTGCGYCGRVLAVGRELGVEFNLKNIMDPGVEEELVAKGGKLQVPYLIDEERGVSLYESQAIIDYLHKTFTKTS